ncbi:MAG TPA: carbonic anhydrase [Mycobacteriales bacterium]|jgi:carbonic anhydrase|nr:carbonic anhydrase [Mycobacteriales bacterium]
MTTAFDDLLADNERYAEARPGEPAGQAGRRLAVVTCMDPRLDPLRMLGLGAGDAVVLRNAGGRVTDDVLAALTLARHLLGVDRILVVPHTKCRMAVPHPDALHDAVREAGGPDTHALSFLTAADQALALHDDLARLRSSPYLEGAKIAGYIYDVATGRLTPGE